MTSEILSRRNTHIFFLMTGHRVGHPPTPSHFRSICVAPGTQNKNCDVSIRHLAITSQTSIYMVRETCRRCAATAGMCIATTVVHCDNGSQQRLKQLNEALERRVEERTADLTRAHDRLRDLASELVRAEQRERHRIAQLLHDDLQQRLYGIQMKAALIGRDVAAGTSERLPDHVAAIEKMLAETFQRARELSVDLSPPILMNEGLTEVLKWLASQMRERHDLTIKVNTGESFYMEDEGLRTLLFQITRELLFNVVKHAGVNRATVDLERDSGGLVIRGARRGGRL